jgi:hypothetical protein
LALLGTDTTIAPPRAKASALGTSATLLPTNSHHATGRVRTYGLDQAGRLKAALVIVKVNIKNMKDKIKRLEKREASLVSRGRKAVDEGRERKADRLLGRAARVQNRVIKTKEKRAASKKK